MDTLFKDSEKLEILFNKSFGVSTTLPGVDISQMPSVNAGDKIIPASQIFTQEIPPLAPVPDNPLVTFSEDQVHDLVQDLLFIPPAIYPARAGLTCTRWYSTSRPWIVKYENLQLNVVQPQRSFSGNFDKGQGVIVNLLAHTIPFNFDPNLNYGVSVHAYDSESAGFVLFPSDNQAMPWYYDNDAGFITFYGNRNSYLVAPYNDLVTDGYTEYQTTDIPPLMTFWRYEGDFGLSSSGTGATGEAGPTGEKGDKGDTGDMGPTGFTGYTGYVGEKGDMGPTGYIGYTGPKGDASLTGSTGDVGATGEKGEKGDMGPTGDKGDKGDIGDMGPTGFTGYTGYVGEKGDTGDKGDIGDMGPTGYIGYTGPKGDASLTGSTGDVGATGEKGDKGDMGPTGEKGDKGEIGDMGPTGFTGYTGYVGEKGEKGDTGDKGDMGPTGYIGYTGPKGDASLTGSTGDVGATGEKGDKGDMGPTGEKGDKGDMGPTGFTGYTGYVGEKGDTGDKGDQGDMGPTGYIGYTGPKGDASLTGSTGDVGATGDIGATGEKGDNGDVGPTGEKGGKGDVGDLGPTGYTGAKGDIGETANTGATGSIGPTGFTGAKGDSGETANTGATGSIGPTGPAGSGGGGAYANDTWMLTYLLGQPPAIVFDNPTYTSDAIYFSWGYPVQYKVGWGENLWLPSISSFTLYITMTDGAIYYITRPTNVGQVEWLKNNISNSSSYVTLFALRKTPMSSPENFKNMADPSTGVLKYSYTYYDSSLNAALASSSVNTITGYYGNPSNFGAGVNEGSKDFIGAPVAVTISGTFAQYGELIANTTVITDEYGMPDSGSFTYQWYRNNNSSILGASGNKYVLTQEDVGSAIRVEVKYIPHHGTQESVFSAPTALIQDVNDAPNGTVTISGSNAQNELLTANTVGISDLDGIGKIYYTWKRNTLAIPNYYKVEGATYRLSQDDVGCVITVTVDYTDGQNHDESLTSAPTLEITDVNDPPSGEVTITGDMTEGQILNVSNNLIDLDGIVGVVSYQWKRGNAGVIIATGNTYTLTRPDVGSTIIVTASYTDKTYGVQTVDSDPTDVVKVLNHGPIGAVTIDGIYREDEILTANTSEITDEDGMTLSVFTYKWYSGTTLIAGATSSTYKLTQAEVNKTIKVEVKYTDDYDTQETVTYISTATIENVNDDPRGNLIIDGSNTQNATLTANTSGITDEDGLPLSSTFIYKWYRTLNAVTTLISGATASTYTLTQDDVDYTITVTVDYTDNCNKTEHLTSNAFGPIVNVNDLPTVGVTIDGIYREDETLTANTSGIEDKDGTTRSVFTYQWYRGTTLITNATTSTYRLIQADVSKTIKVEVTYTDDYYTGETVTYVSSATVANVNDDPSGNLIITGSSAQNATLTANTGGISDEDGMPASNTFIYKWYRTLNAITSIISGATASTYILKQADVGYTITATLDYTDNCNKTEQLTSNAIGPIVNVDDDPTGSVTISGSPYQEEILTASHTLIDPDGMSEISYQWNRDGSPILSATTNTYNTLVSDLGAQITVTASYIDFYSQEQIKRTSNPVIIIVAVGPTEPGALTSISLVSSNNYSNSATIYKVSTATSIGSVPLVKGTSAATVEFDAPIHRQANRGLYLQGPSGATLMTLSAALNGVAGPSVAYTGFPAIGSQATPQSTATPNITITPNRVVDYYGTGNANSNFYLTSKNVITAGGLSTGNAINTLAATQTFATTPSSTSTASTSFYYDTPVTTAPTGSINSLSISTLTKVSGVSIYDTSGSSTIMIDASATNMGAYFYRSPLITYTYAIDGGSAATKSETNLTNVKSSDISGNVFKTGNLNFSSPITLTNVTSITSIAVTASASNIFGTGALTSKTFNVITDAASVTFANAMNQSSIPLLIVGTPVVGRRVWSAPSVSNNCPDLSYNGILYYNCPYDNSWDITSANQTSANGSVDTSSELIIRNGLFTTAASSYIDYTTRVGNTGINYSGVARTGYRFVTFCWKMPTRTGGGYGGLTFTFNSINSLTPYNTGILTLGINNPLSDVGQQILAFYAFQDAAAPSFVNTQFESKYNTYWLSGNNKTAQFAGAGNMFITNSSQYRYGYYTALKTSISPVSGSTTNLSVVMPLLNTTNNTTYLYLRLGIPMSNTNIQFGSVSATLSL